MRPPHPQMAAGALPCTRTESLTPQVEKPAGDFKPPCSWYWTTLMDLNVACGSFSSRQALACTEIESLTPQVKKPAGDFCHTALPFSLGIDAMQAGVSATHIDHLA